MATKQKNICDQLGCFGLSVGGGIACNGDDNLAQVVSFYLHDHESVLCEKQKSGPDFTPGICIGYVKGTAVLLFPVAKYDESFLSREEWEDVGKGICVHI